MDRISSTRETAAAILDIAECAPDVFVAGGGTHNHLGTVFGGRLLAQALHAAVRTVETMPVTSLHAYFLAAGDTARPLEYSVTRLRDSRRFANRQVAVLQGGQTIFMLMCQFHAPEAGFTHQFAEMPPVPAPEAVASVQDFVRENEGPLDPAIVHNFTGALPIEMKPVAPEDYFLRRPATAARDFWFRLQGRIFDRAGNLVASTAQECLLRRLRN